MKAAVVSAFGAAPRYEEFAVPVAASEDEMLVDVIAAGLHPRVRSQAAGSHYTSTDELPLVPGVDGVGRGEDGLLRYFLLEDTTRGSMADQVLIDARRSVILPDDTNPVAVAAAMNPAMSSWVALRQRAHFQAGQKVLVLGATGNSGQMAVQVAKLLGASQIIAAGRDAGRLARLPALGATSTARLEGDPEAAARGLAAAADVDIVIDYVWGEVTASAMAAIITARPDRSKPLTWIEIGSVAGLTAPIPSAALRAARLQIVGSGVGSVGAAEYVAELPALAQEITKGRLAIDALPMPLAAVEQAWADAAHTPHRIVLLPRL